MKNLIREKIDNITQLDVSQLTDENLRCHYETGLNIMTKNSQGHKASWYRKGVHTNLGDIEKSLWIELVKQLIERENDQSLFDMLLEWEKAANHIHSMTEKDFVYEALKAYACRIYDNKAWFDYVRFNRKYRPAILDNDSTLIPVCFDCCGCEDRIPREQIKHNYETSYMVPCPFCNKYTTFSHVIVSYKRKIKNRSRSHGK